LAARAAQRLPRGARPLTDYEVGALAAEIIDIDGDLLRRHKVFTRTHLVAEVAPRLYGRDPADLDRVLDRICSARAVVPLIGVEGTREQAYTTVQVLEAEHTIARTIEALADRPGPAVTDDQVIRAAAAKEQAIGHALTAGQCRVVGQLCQASGAATVVVGVAGSGKTTALDAASTALGAAGYRVLGSSTSGQAARTLGTEAHIESAPWPPSSPDSTTEPSTWTSGPSWSSTHADPGIVPTGASVGGLRVGIEVGAVGIITGLRGRRVAGRRA